MERLYLNRSRTALTVVLCSPAVPIADRVSCLLHLLQLVGLRLELCRELAELGGDERMIGLAMLLRELAHSRRLFAKAGNLVSDIPHGTAPRSYAGGSMRGPLSDRGSGLSAAGAPMALPTMRRV